MGHLVITDSQHCFQLDPSCLTNMLNFCYDIINFNDESKMLDIIYLDFLKALDKHLHQRLLADVKSYCLDGNILQ